MRGVRPVIALLLVLSLSGCTSAVCDTTGLLCPDENAKYSTDFETGNVVLHLSDLPPGYNLTGETTNITANMSGESQQRYQNQRVLEYHSRSFRLANQSQRGEKPLLIISSASIYESEQAAVEAIQKEASDLESSGAHVRTREVVSGINATEVRFENQRGIKTVILYGHSSNLRFQVIVAGTENYHDDVATRLFVKMYSAVS